jgi:hypothetical protein
MSIFAAHTQKTITVPSHPDQPIVVRKLSGLALRKAREADQFATIETVKQVGPQLQKELAELGGAAAREDAIEKAKSDPLFGLDVATVLRKGIVSIDGAAPTTEAIDDLDEESMDYIARAIAELSVKPRGEDGPKNG